MMRQHSAKFTFKRIQNCLFVPSDWLVSTDEQLRDFVAKKKQKKIVASADIVIEVPEDRGPML